MPIKSLIFLIGISIIQGLFYSCQPGSGHRQNEDVFPDLLLLSKGLVTDTLKMEFLQFIEEEPTKLSMAVIVNASSSKKKKLKKTKKVKERVVDLGMDTSRVELFDLKLRDPNQLEDFDIIYILGGNPFLLLEEVKSTGSDKVLIKLASSGKKIMGYSAGSLLLGPDLNLMNDLDTLLGFNEMGLEELSCLNLYDFVIFPHFSDFTMEVETLAEEIDRLEKKMTTKLYRINDNQAILYQNGKVRLISE